MTRFHHNIAVPEVYNHQLEEEKIVQFWKKQQIFENLRKSRREKNEGKFLFRCAPVAPSAHPHSGHILNNLIKDALKRYGYQRNLQVENTFRWDDHSLSIQYEVDRNLGITHPTDLQKIDLKLYNDQCRAIAEENTAEWMSVFEKLGLCMDSPKKYCTSDTRYMEGVWKVFKQLYDKGRVYRDTKVLPYSPGCFVYLENFEAEQNLKEVSEIGFTVAVDIIDSKEKLLIWTTNPSALAFNNCLCVNPKDVYVKVRFRNQIYILSKNQLQFVFKNSSEYTITEEVMGTSLEDLICKPLCENVPLNKEHRIYTKSMVFNDSIGTGIAPANDFEVQPFHILNTREVKQKKPHCLKTGTPLVKKRVESWFVRVENLVEDLVKNISLVNWIPKGQISAEELINWLKENPTDWSISRNRNWGTPLPIWSSESGDEVVCVGSLEQLKTMSGRKYIEDLHRDVIDGILIPSKTPGNPPLCRVPDVFDGWFESCVLPSTWKQSGEAAFVAEGINHKRGWFYTMLALTTALSEPPPFHNVIAHGLTMEPDNSKVIKRKHNHNDPMKLYEKYGADALRLYLVSQSDSNFIVEEKGVADMSEKVIKPLFRIYSKCTSQMGSPSWVNYGYVTEWYNPQRNALDGWILSCSESLLKLYIKEMDSYRINTVLPRVFEFIKQIEEFYIPIRCPEKVPEANETSLNSLSCHRSTTLLFNSIYRMCLILAPVAPFLTEYIFQVHRKWMVFYRRPESLHQAKLITPNETIINPDLELSVQRMRNVIKIVQTLRAQQMIPIEYKINEVIVIHHREDVRQGIATVKECFTKFINTRDIVVSADYRELKASLRVNLKQSSYSKVKQKVLNELSKEDLDLLVKGDNLENSIQLDDLDVSYDIPNETDPNCAIACTKDFLVVIKMNKSLFFYEEGTTKELVHRLCNLKKKHNYYRSDCVVIYYSTDDECLKNAIAKHGERLKKTANCDLRTYEDDKNAINYPEERLIVKGAAIKLYLDVKKCE